MIIFHQTYHYSLFLLIITLVVYNIQCVSYWMTMITSILTSSRNLIYRISYDDSLWLHCQSTFVGYYYFLDVSPYFIFVVTDTFVLALYLPIHDVTVPGDFSPMTLSAYKFSFSISFSFAFVICSNSSTSTMHYFFKGVPICSISKCLHPIIMSQKLANRDHCKDFVKKFACICSVLQYAIDLLLLSTCSYTKIFVYQCVLSNLSWVPAARFLPIVLHVYRTLVILE